jgi:hypothetical protein
MAADAGYFNELLIEVNLVLSLLPSPLHNCNNGKRDAGCDQSIFDRGCTGFVSEKAFE